ncbi:MAG: hypothetical protein J6Y29_04540 [Clostridiales bacterium]|nr:hypothetical protein [Clostridiales bacterium]
MASKPARLHKCNSHSVLEEQLTISVKQLLAVAFICILFFIIALTIKGPTYGIL